MYKQKQYWDIYEHSCENTYQHIEQFKNQQEFQSVIQQLPHNDLSNIFYNPEDNTIKEILFNDQFCRLKRFSLFKNGIKPSVEDTRNQKIIYLIYYGLTDYAIINEIWKDIYDSFLDGVLCKQNTLNGVVVSDKASDNVKVGIRYEFWINTDKSDYLKNIIFKNIQSKYFKQGGHKAKCFVIDPTELNKD